MATYHGLPPYPDGWFAACFSSELARGDVRAVRFCGRELVLWRTESGHACVADAFCPHMGAHLAHGGTVRNETLRCPFHAFEFDPHGRCTATGYGTPPPRRCALRTWPVVETNGVVLVWYEPEGRAPYFDVPSLDFDGWLPAEEIGWDLASHPQETTENSADLGHLAVVHGYESVDVLSPLTTAGAYLHATYAMRRSAGFLGRREKIRAVFEIHVHGLGYSFVDVKVPELGLESRHFAFATPIETGRMKLRISLSMRTLARPSRIHPLLAVVPRALLHRVLPRLAFRAYKHDVGQDFRIWENKVYTQPPILAKGDGPVGAYRRWARQFYPELREQRRLERVAQWTAARAGSGETLQ
jgi:nitrite reductase/ring-hydroxylating ferredoxin subunit